MSEDFRCGLVALVGRPNVGKSTLLNAILGQKVSITSRKPQTTRHRILGIKTLPHLQAIYVDTPGLHRKARRAINRVLNRTATEALHDVDVIVMLVEAGKWTDEDDLVLERLREARAPVILAVNKVDRIKDKQQLLPYLQDAAKRHDFHEVVPVSATRGVNVDRLEQLVADLLPPGPPLFPEDQVTDRSLRFMVAEQVREKLFRKLGKELPYGISVEIESFEEEPRLVRISALIWVEKASHKAIVIGHKGTLLKEIGEQARKDMEALLGKQVFLQLWVKVKEGWADSERALRSLGFDV